MRAGVARKWLVAVVIVAGLLVGVIGGSLLRRQRINQADPATPKTLTIEMRGRDYLWWFRYPGRDGMLNTADDIAVGNELHVPVGTQVNLQIRSDDYVYAMTIGKSKQRQVAIPGRTTTMTLSASEPASHEILADPLCSVWLFHDESMGRILVQPPDEFRSWLQRHE